jgi:hypothetical protein
VQHGGEGGPSAGRVGQGSPHEQFFLSGHQRKPNAYSHRIGQIGNLDTAFAAVV